MGKTSRSDNVPFHLQPFSRANACMRVSTSDEAFVVNRERRLVPSFKNFDHLNFVNKYECTSRRFLGLPFKSDPLGEGIGQQIDPDPKYSFGGLDCMTFIEESMALVYSNDLNGFETTLDDIRYRGGVATFTQRNHFVEADWVRSNTLKGYINDITWQIGGNDVRQVEVVIDRVNWIMKNPNFSDEQKTKIIAEFKELNLDSPTIETIDYIPFSAFYTFDGTSFNPDIDFIKKLPELSIVLFIRNEPDAQKVGTAISHMAFLFAPKNKKGERYFPFLRHVTSRAGKLIDEPFFDYATSQMPYRAGIAVFEVLSR